MEKFFNLLYSYLLALVIFWSQLGLQQGASSIIELINYFHDHIIILLTIIILFVSYVFIVLLTSKKLDRILIDSHLLELIWTVIPMVFLVFIALPSLYLLYMTEDVSRYGLSVKVVGHQWYWEYEYFNLLGDVSFNSYILSADISESNGEYRLLDVDNRLCLPYMLGSILIVTSRDVLHSWTVPSLGVKTDAIPGRLNYLNLLPNQYGIFYGQCSELCGTNHSFIPIVVEVTSTQGLLSYLTALL